MWLYVIPVNTEYQKNYNVVSLTCMAKCFTQVYYHFNYRAMRCISAVFAVMRSPSVTFVDHVKTNKHIFEIFSPSGSDTILVILLSNSLSIHTRFSVIAPGASPGETKMW